MNNLKQVCQNDKLDEESPQKIGPVEKYPVLDDRNFSHTITEYVGGFSLCPSYSIEQLRKISYIEKRKVSNKADRRKWFPFPSDRTVPVRRQMLVKYVHCPEAIL